MYASNSNDPGNLHIEVAHTRSEAMGIIERLKNTGTPLSQIHLVGKDLTEFAEFKWDADVEMHRTGNAADKFKSLFTGEDAVVEGLKGTDLPETQIEHYKQVVDNGGVLIYTKKELDSEPDIDPNSFLEKPVIDRGMNGNIYYFTHHRFY